MMRRMIKFILVFIIPSIFFGCKSVPESSNGVIAVIENFKYPDTIIAPFSFPAIQVPNIPNKRYSILGYGAQNGGKLDCTEAIKETIAEASRNGGGIVVIPEGIWLTGPIHLESNINLYLEEGAQVIFSQNFEDYLPAVLWRHEGIEVYSYSPFIYAIDKENIAITGKGEFHGQGKAWWDYRFTEKQKYYSGSVKRLQKMGEEGIPVQDRIFDSLGYKFLCPPFVAPVRCKNIWIEGVTFKYGAFWTITPTYCENVVIRNINIETFGDYGHTPNGDGVNPSSSKNVLIENSILDTGDDCIAIKSGKNKDGRRVGMSTENVIVRNVTGYKGHGGVVIGSEISGGVQNVYAYNCNFFGTERIIRIKAERGRGGFVRNCWYENMQADTIEKEAIRLNLLYSGKRLPEMDVDETTPRIENIHIKNVTCKYSKRNAIQLLGIPEMMISNVYFDSINIVADKGIEINDARNIYLDKIYIEPISTSLLRVNYSSNIKVDNMHSATVREDKMPIKVLDSKNIQLSNVSILSNHPKILEISGSISDSIFLDKGSFNSDQIDVINSANFKAVKFY
ncbi:MAG: glycoside hydrolase family 28 protein [Bacteroidales bacterium]|nr:glycoside hydrolase family 28 protein [Bacteroidales bacterium]